MYAFIWRCNKRSINYIVQLSRLWNDWTAWRNVYLNHDRIISHQVTKSMVSNNPVGQKYLTFQ